MEGIGELYKQFGILADAKDEAGEHESAFVSILAAVKGTEGEKRLASQFIARFFKYFPKLQENAIDAMLDLCEDEDNMIRRQAIKLLPDLCKDTPEHLPRIADVLTQLLQSDDVAELTIVRNALTLLFRIEPKGTIGGLFSQILSGEEAARESAIKFLKSVVEEFGKKVLHPSPETEEYLVEEIKKAVADVTGEEFRTFMAILSSLNIMADAHQELADIVTEQADLRQPFQPSDGEMVDRFLSCARIAIPCFAKGASVQAFFGYITERIIPHLNELGTSEDGEDVKLEMLKICADMSPHKLSDENVKAAIEPVYNLLLQYMPLPPSEGEDSKSNEESTEPKLQFSYVECLIFTFHQLAKKFPEFLTEASAAERLKDFRLRLQYFAQGCQVYIKQLRLSLQGKTGPALQEEESKIKIVALRTTSNINALIKAKTQASTATISRTEEGTVVDEKRKRAGITPITFDLPIQTKLAKKHKSNTVSVHSPPGRRVGSSKSNTIAVYTPPGRRVGASNGVVRGQSMPEGNRNRSGPGRGKF